MVRTKKPKKEMEKEFDLPEPTSQPKSDIDIIKQAMLTLEDKERDIIAVGTWEKMLAVIEIVKVLGKRELEKQEAMEQLELEALQWESKHNKDLISKLSQKI